MILADKIIKLRKQLGWSQEELAEKLDVSRQSVSKWESTNSIPDLNKVIKLAEVFNVSTDYLLKDDIEKVEFGSDIADNCLPQISLEQASEYVELEVQSANLIVKGVSLAVCSIVPMFFLFVLMQTGQLEIGYDLAAALGLVGVFAMVAWGVSFLVKSSHMTSELEKITTGRFELAYGVHGIFEERQEKFSGIYQKRISQGVAIFIFSAVPLIFAAILRAESELIFLSIIGLFFLVAFGLFLVVPASKKYEAIDYILKEGDLDADKSETVKNAEKLGAFYWPLAVAIYLGWSLYTMNWGLTWIVFPVAAVGFAASIGLMGLLQKDESR